MKMIISLHIVEGLDEHLGGMGLKPKGNKLSMRIPYLGTRDPKN